MSHKHRRNLFCVDVIVALMLLGLCQQGLHCSAQIYTAGDLDLGGLNGTRVEICQNNTVDSNGTCVCQRGYGFIGSVCSACPVGQYKDTAGNLACDSCPMHADTVAPIRPETSENGSISCARCSPALSYGTRCSCRSASATMPCFAPTSLEVCGSLQTHRREPVEHGDA